MTATDAGPLVCPNCQGTNTAIGGSGSAICTDCAHLWNPNDAQPKPIAPLAPFGLPPVEEVFGRLPADIAAVEREHHEDYIGGIATLEGGQTGEVVAFRGMEAIIVRLDSGDLVEVPLTDVERIMPPVVIPEPAVQPDTVDELAPDLQLAMQLAQVIIRAGCEAVNGTGSDITPGVPPTGYLPPDIELISVIETAAGLAIGMLLEVLEADIDKVLVWVGAVDDETEVATETTEDASGEHTSNE